MIFFLPEIVFVVSKVTGTLFQYLRYFLNGTFKTTAVATTTLFIFRGKCLNGLTSWYLRSRSLISVQRVAEFLFKIFLNANEVASPAQRLFGFIKLARMQISSTLLLLKENSQD